MGVKVILLVIFFAVMAVVGIYSRRHTKSVDAFVLGGRSVGPWLTAFAYGTSYFFGGCICRICGSVWMEIRNCIHMDWNWECSSWKSFGLGCAREKDKGYESTFTVKDDAGFFW